MSEDLPTAFGKVLRKQRVAAGYTQMGLAADAGLHLNAVGLLERGERTANLETVFMLAKTLGMKPSLLIVAVEKMRPRLNQEI